MLIYLNDDMRQYRCELDFELIKELQQLANDFGSLRPFALRELREAVLRCEVNKNFAETSVAFCEALFALPDHRS